MAYVMNNHLNNEIGKITKLEHKDKFSSKEQPYSSLHEIKLKLITRLIREGHL